MVKNPACNAGDADSIPGWGRSPEGGHGNRQRSLVGYSPWGHKELDTTEVTWHDAQSLL